LTAEVTCDRFGRTLAYTSIRFVNARGELVARGSHTKYVAQAWKGDGNRVEEARREEETGGKEEREAKAEAQGLPTGNPSDVNV